MLRTENGRKKQSFVKFVSMCNKQSDFNELKIAQNGQDSVTKWPGHSPRRGETWVPNPANFCIESKTFTG